MQMPHRFLPLLALVLALAAYAPSRAQEEMRGHGGPVRALSVTADGSVAISGSFDSRAILWSLARGEALQVLRLHDSAVNAAVALPGDRFATAGQDGRVAIWAPGTAAPLRVLGPGGDGHDAPVVALALSPDGRALASASWDRTVRVWPLDREAPPLVLEGHDDNVNAVAFLGDGVISAAQDGGLRIFAPAGGPPRTLRFAAPLATLQVSRAGEIVVGGGDGVVRIILTGGTDRMVRRWDAISGDHLGTVAMAGGRRSARGIQGPSGAEVLPRLRRLPHAFARRRQSRGADAARHFRPPDRDVAGL
jgi:cytochrome c